MAASEDKIRIGDLMGPDIADLLDGHHNHDARAAMMELLPAELADLLLAMPIDKRVMAARLLPRPVAAEVFAHLEYDQQQELLEAMGSEQIAALFNAMDPDDRIDFFEEADQELRDQLLALMKPEERAQTEAILEYPEDSVGREVTPDYLTVQPQWTVAEALDHIRREGKEAESLDTLYVVDPDGRLLNSVRLRRIVLADPATKIADLLRPETQIISLRATDDRETMVHTFERYDLPVLPVVDDAGKMIGIVTFDDVADVAEEEMTEDMQKMGGMEALEEPYHAASIVDMVRKRVVWLMVLFVGGLMTVSAMGAFEQSIKRYAILAMFIPLIIASGGNSGSQAASMMIRSLAIGDLELSDWWMVVRRELVSGLLLGSVLGLIGFVIATSVSTVLFAEESAGAGGAVRFGAAIGTAIVGVVLVGNLIGSMLPFVLKRIGLDEATGSTPFVSTIVDVAGLVIYFAVANLIIRGAPI